MSQPLNVLRFDPSMRSIWDRFVADSRNGTFLFDRGYMDYHADRFQDCSLLVRRGDQLVALLPANRRGDVLVSHGGLTYGGFVVDQAMSAPLMMDVFDASLAWMAADGVQSWEYKTVPAIYHRHPAEEDRYALFRAGAELTRRDVLSVLATDDHPIFQERRRRGARKAANAGLTLSRSDNQDDWAAFWTILNARLSDRYEKTAVHSLSEITMLAAIFPAKILLYLVKAPDGAVLAGTVIYDTGPVVHAQYISGSDEGLRIGALDLLFSELINVEFSGRRWFSFGVSNEKQGQYLNVGLVEFKEGFGGRTIVHDYFHLTVASAQAAVNGWRDQ